MNRRQTLLLVGGVGVAVVGYLLFKRSSSTSAVAGGVPVQLAAGGSQALSSQPAIGGGGGGGTSTSGDPSSASAPFIGSDVAIEKKLRERGGGVVSPPAGLRNDVGIGYSHGGVVPSGSRLPGSRVSTPSAVLS